MNPNQLEETTMNTKTRNLLQVLPLDDSGKNIFEELMGEDVEMRKAFIKNSALYVKNLDIQILMKIATWNVNSVNARIEHLTKLIKKDQSDIYLIQELQNKKKH